MVFPWEKTQPGGNSPQLESGEHLDRFQFPAAIVLLTVEEQCGRGHMIGIAKRGLLPLEIPILPVGSAGLPLGEVVADVRRARN